jgi:hypothetical protein
MSRDDPVDEQQQQEEDDEDSALEQQQEEEEEIGPNSSHYHGDSSLPKSQERPCRGGRT